jgi:acyl-CoA synthetase (AMP-forming)/AMP-acid ligase II
MEPTLDVTSLYNRRAVNRWERTSVGDLTERVTWSYPDKEAVIGAAGAYADPRFARVTYRQADQAANQVANALLARGLRRGDIVMLFCENSVEGLLFKLGAAKAGVVCAPLNPMMAPDMVAAMIDLVQPRLAVVDAELWPRARQPFGERGLPVAVTITIGGGPVEGSVSFTDFIAGQSDAEPEAEIHGDDVWEILFTSGTTALPKGVMISHTSTYLAALGFAQSLTRGLRIENDLRLCSYLRDQYGGHYAGAAGEPPAS